MSHRAVLLLPALLLVVACGRDFSLPDPPEEVSPFEVEALTVEPPQLRPGQAAVISFSLTGTPADTPVVAVGDLGTTLRTRPEEAGGTWVFEALVEESGWPEDTERSVLVKVTASDGARLAEATSTLRVDSLAPALLGWSLEPAAAAPGVETVLTLTTSEPLSAVEAAWSGATGPEVACAASGDPAVWACRFTRGPAHTASSPILEGDLVDLAGNRGTWPTYPAQIRVDFVDGCSADAAGVRLHLAYGRPALVRAEADAFLAGTVVRIFGDAARTELLATATAQAGAPLEAALPGTPEQVWIEAVETTGLPCPVLSPKRELDVDVATRAPGDTAHPVRLRAGTLDVAIPAAAELAALPEVDPAAYASAALVDDDVLEIPADALPPGAAPAWTRLSPATSPPPLHAHAMAYDEARGELILFGGRRADRTVSNATWVFDGSTWSQRAPTTSPPARSHAGMTYDPLRRRVVLHGGQNAGGFGLGDLWEWDGTTWTERTPDPAPPQRWGHALAFYEGEVLAIDGWLETSVFDPNSTLGDLWSWDGARWAAIVPPGGGYVDAQSFASATDPLRQSLLVIGGHDHSDPRDDFVPKSLWGWNGEVWIWPAGWLSLLDPWERVGAAAAWHRGAGKVVLFGGRQSTRQRDDPEVGLPDDTGFCAGLRTGVWQRLQSPARPAGREYTALGEDPAGEGVVLFGGLGADEQPLADTWRLGGGVRYPALVLEHLRPLPFTPAAITVEGIAAGRETATGATTGVELFLWDFARGSWRLVAGNHAELDRELETIVTPGGLSGVVGPGGELRALLRAAHGSTADAGSRVDLDALVIRLLE